MNKKDNSNDILVKFSDVTKKYGDLVVLDKDPNKVNPMEIINIPVERTMVGGKWMYES